MTLPSLQLRLLQARDARAETIARLTAALPGGHALVFLSLNVPGPDKTSLRIESVFQRAREALELHGLLEVWRKAPALRTVRDEGRDALGPWLAVACPGDPGDIKRGCIALEERLAAGRLVDLDVYDHLGRQIDRGSLGLPPRRCLACSEAAVDCIRAGRHADGEILAAVDRLLQMNDLARLADALVEGARIELELTPKPGLVDRRDNGSHPDLSLELMERSIDLLPEYHEELLRLSNPSEAGFHDNRLAACVEAGRRAEERMLSAIGTNAHRGYIFLSGIVLLGYGELARPHRAGADSRPRGAAAALSATAAAGTLSSAVADVARRLVTLRRSAQGSHGETARTQHGVGGIIGEALNGLPSIFEHALPALERAEARYGATDVAHHSAMATLMAVVEDTTTLHRCGEAGLKRLRQDGRRILAAIESGGDYVPLLEQLNEEYRAAEMTMGGVADCLAITIAIRRAGV